MSEGAKEIFFEVLLFALGFALMSVRFLFGTYPFGLALVGSTKKKLPFALAGALLSVVFLMDASIPYLVALIGLTGLRISASFIKRSDYKKAELGSTNGKRIADIIFNEGVELRVVVTALVALGVGIYTVIANGYLYYDVFVLIFNTVFVSIMTYCLCGLFESKEKRSFLFGISALLFCLVYFFSGKELGGIDFTIALSYGAVLYISKNYGGIKGAALGLLLGAAQGGTLSAVLGIGGIISGFLWSLSPYLAIMSSFILSLGYAISVSGYEAVVSLTPEILAASLIMYPLLRFEVLPKPVVISNEEAKGMVVYHLENRSAEIKGKVASLSQAYGSVAKALKKLSQRTKNPDKRGYLDMALESCERHCCICPKNNICWRRDIDTTENNINRMGEALFVRKKVAKGDVEEKFLHRCPNIDKIMEELNAKNKTILAQSVKNDKLDVCAQDYESVSKMMDSIFKKEAEITVDKELSERAVRASAKCGLVCEKIEVVGDGSKRIVATGVDIQRSKCTALELRQEMEKISGFEELEKYIGVDFQFEKQLLEKLVSNHDLDSTDQAKIDGVKHYFGKYSIYIPVEYKENLFSYLMWDKSDLKEYDDLDNIFKVYSLDEYDTDPAFAIAMINMKMKEFSEDGTDMNSGQFGTLTEGEMQVFTQQLVGSDLYMDGTATDVDSLSYTDLGFVFRVIVDNYKGYDACMYLLYHGEDATAIYVLAKDGAASESELTTLADQIYKTIEIK